MMLATIIALLLPSVSHSLYFDRDDSIDRTTNDLETIDPHPKTPASNAKLKIAFVHLKRDFLQAYTNVKVLKWSLWGAFATCGYTQVLNYIQLLWSDTPGNQEIYNGAVEATYTFIGRQFISL